MQSTKGITFLSNLDSTCSAVGHNGEKSIGKKINRSRDCAVVGSTVVGIHWELLVG